MSCVLCHPKNLWLLLWTPTIASKHGSDEPRPNSWTILFKIYLNVILSSTSRSTEYSVALAFSDYIFVQSSCFSRTFYMSRLTNPHWRRNHIRYFGVLLTVHLSIFISVINQIDAQNFCFTVSLFHASTCFEHMCLSSGGQDCITQHLVSSHWNKWVV